MKILSLFLVFAALLSFAACGTEKDDSLHASSGTSTDSLTGDSSVTDTENSSESSGNTEVWQPVHEVDNLFLAGDQYHQDVLVYDLDQPEGQRKTWILYRKNFSPPPKSPMVPAGLLGPVRLFVSKDDI